jgi:glycerol-3-phosphate acyltransferase PlsY
MEDYLAAQHRGLQCLARRVGNFCALTNARMARSHRLIWRWYSGMDQRLSAAASRFMDAVHSGVCVCLSASMYACVCLSVCLSACLPVCLSVCLYSGGLGVHTSLGLISCVHLLLVCVFLPCASLARRCVSLLLLFYLSVHLSCCIDSRTRDSALACCTLPKRSFMAVRLCGYCYWSILIESAWQRSTTIS